MRILARSLVALLAVVIMAAFAERVLAQGYEGLMAPAPGETTPDRPPGYEGVMPGWIAPPPREEVVIPKAVPPKAVTPPQAARTVTVPAVKGRPAQTPVPGRTLKKQTPSDELKTLSMIRGLEVDMNKVPDRLEGNAVRLPAVSIEALSRPRPRMNGMLPLETSIRRNVAQIMSYVKNERLSQAQREENAKNAYKQLEDLRAGLKFKGQAPESIYQRMGLPDIYIKEEKESISSTLAFVEEAMAELKGYQ